MVRLKGLNLKYISAVIIRLNVIIYIFSAERAHPTLVFSTSPADNVGNLIGALAVICIFP